MRPVRFIKDCLPLGFRVWLRRDAKYLPARVRARFSGQPPVPPPELLFLVAGSYDARHFLRSGESAAAAMLGMLGEAGEDFARLGRVLDFGCGSGRVIRHLRGPELHGTDYNPQLVEWCARRLRHASFKVNPLEGPLPYADESFGLVYAFSVFTHLSHPLQRRWMEEVRRVLRPGGLLYLTLHGRSFLDVLDERQRAEFDGGRLAVIHEGDEGTNRCAAFHPEGYVRGPFSEGFGIVGFRAEGARGGSLQDAWLLRKA